MKVIPSRLILPFLQQMERQTRLKTFSALLGGAILSLLGPLLLTLFCLTLSLTLISSYGFLGAYGIITAVSLPFFFLIAYRLRGSVLEHAVPDADSLSGRIMQRWIAPLLVIVEIANVGPRLVLWAVDRIRGQRRVRGMGLGRIAQALEELTAAEQGISPAQLLFPGESPKQLEPILAYLLYYEIVDLSKRGDRVWMISHVRQRLSAMAR
jgi:hypothetical protein